MTVSLVAGRPMADQIIHAHRTGTESDAMPVPGQLVTVSPDRVYVQDGNAPTIAKLYADHGFSTVFDRTKVSFVFDHSVLVANVDMADRMKEADEFAAALGVDVQARGRGISHVIAAELGWFAPGQLVLGSDSHTCVGGAFGAMGLGMGASDITAAMVSGATWLRVPETVVVEFVGHPHPLTRPRDVLIDLLADVGQDDFLYRSVEFVGEWIRSLTPDGRASMASLGVELGAKCVFLEDLNGDVPVGTTPDKRTIRRDIHGIEPVVSRPHLPANSATLAELAGTRVDYVFIGSCTNSRLEDLAEVAAVVRGRKVAAGTQFVITPGSRDIYRDAARLGYIDTLMEAGAVVTPPGCGACVGTQGPLPARGDNVLSTMNRNFKGRMGNPDADIYLSTPIVAAASALVGAIPTLKDIT